ncbi:Hypothetical protein PHPALM_471 [Phytophthora palmivora]|uniref:Uncharacterized protein n=1 Tax=Phytophthora palmivora TaxID=4796 RepID=A0A2P4YUS2_9STRA|nr:Hypothetical protein PHPALM_471 [Phytophthora palmivora]
MFHEQRQQDDFVKRRKSNMHNFSRSVVLPDAATPASVNDISAILSVLHTYYATLMTSEARDLVRSLHAFVKQKITSIRTIDDLQHSIFWIDGILENFREVKEQDLNGSDTRRSIRATITRSNTDFQSNQPRRHTFSQHHLERKVVLPETTHRRKGLSRYRHRGREVPNYLQHVSRQGNRELCLRSLAWSGCRGVHGAPSQCVYSNRSHLVPDALHEDVRKYIDERLGGLSPAFRH